MNSMDSQTSLKRKSGSPKTEVKSKRTTTSSPKPETKAQKKAAESKHPQKSRWEPLQPVLVPESQIQMNATKEEDPKSDLRIKDLLEDKEKIVEYLFQTLTGTALQELIPDYLKVQKRSIEELKALCTIEIQKIPSETILQIISGNFTPPDEKEKSSINEDKKLSTEKSNSLQKGDPDIKTAIERVSSATLSPETAESFSNDVLELNPSSNEMKCITDEENQVPISIEEVAKDLYASEKDAEIIELEMRARAIISLLKAKGQNSPDSDSRDCCEEE